MAENIGPEQEEIRLEAALDRIWHARSTRPTTTASQGQAELTQRLDALIAEIRSALGKDPLD